MGRVDAAAGAGRPVNLLHLPAAAQHCVRCMEADATRCHLPCCAADVSPDSLFETQPSPDGSELFDLYVRQAEVCLF